MQQRIAVGEARINKLGMPNLDDWEYCRLVSVCVHVTEKEGSGQCTYQ